MSYSYSEAAKTLEADVPLIDRDALLIVCKEIDEDTPEAETESFIADAHTTVCTLLDGFGIPAGLLSLIEKQLAAHFAVLAYPSTQRENFGPMGRSFSVKAGEGLNATRYGSTAVSLDPTGTLKRFSDGKGQRGVVMRSLGNGILVPETSEA